MNKTGTKILIGVLAAAAVAGAGIAMSMNRVESFAYKYADTDLTQDVVGLKREGTYGGYLAEHEGGQEGEASVDLDRFD